MAKALWNGEVIAESNDVIQVLDVIYFPFSSVNQFYLKPSETKSTCFWKGEASYYTLVVNGKENKDAAWYYDNPDPMAENVRGKIAFWNNVEIER